MSGTLIGLGAVFAVLSAQAAPGEPFIEAAFEPSIAPDGNLAFIARQDDGVELFTAGADGKSRKQLTQSEGAEDTPAWSADGKRIAFVREADGNSDIHVIARDGSGERLLVGGPEAELHPNWSPDGKQIVFTRYSRSAGGRPARLDVYVLELESGMEDRVTKGSDASYASWSPDGRHLAYWRNFEKNAEIVVADADGGNEQRLTRNTAFDGWPAWSPDGKSIAFARGFEAETDIYVIDVATRNEHAAVQGPGRDTAPKWERDGRHLLYDSSEPGKVGIYRVAVPPLGAE